MKASIKKSLTALCAMIFISVTSLSQISGDFRSAVSTGNWGTAASWEQYNGSSWATATVYPGQTANNGNVTIRDTHTITVATAPTGAISSLTVGEGSTGILNIGGFAFSIAGATTIASGGTVNITSATATKTFTGDFTNNGTWNNTAANAPVILVGNITNNGTFNSGTGVYTLNGSTARSINGTISFGSVTQITTGPYTNYGNLTITGTHSISGVANNFVNAGTYVNSSNLTLTTPGTFTNNATATISGATFGGTGSFTNGVNATLNWVTTATGPTTFTATANGNTVIFKATSTQSIRAATYNILTISNTNASGATLGGAVTADSVYVTSSPAGVLSLNGQTLNVKNIIQNNGTLISTTTNSTLTLNGTIAQTIDGSGVWTTGTSGRLLNLVINNSAGVTLNPTLALQNSITLTAGTLTSSTLTLGIPATPFTTTRAAGSLANVPTFNYTSGAYAITYNGGTAINTANELPSVGTPTNGILTVSTAGTNVSLQADATIGTLTTSIASTTTFNLNGFTLNLTLAAPVSNTGVINASASTSTLVFKGTVAQSFALGGTYTSSLISNIFVDNSFSSTGLTLGTTNINVGNLTVNASRFMTLGGLNINIKNNLQNDGTITSTALGSTITMNGSTAQTIDGSGVWTTGTTGRLLNLVINNAAGVTSNSTFALQTSLTLTAGVLTSSTLTIGTPAIPFTTTRTAGSLANVPTFNYTTGAYAITYNGGAAINTGYELPPAGTPTNGVLTVSIANTNVSLQADANIGSLTTSVASTTTFNLNGFSLGLSLTSPISNTGVINASASTSTLIFKGTVAQTFSLIGTYTSSLISNVIIDNSFSSTGLTLGTANINVGNLTVNASRFMTLGGLNINIKNNLQNDGTITSTALGSTITMNGSTAQTIDGSGVWTTGTTGRLLNLVINNTAGVTSNSTIALQTSLTLAAGALTSSTLTIGIPATVFTTTRTAGSLTNAPSFNYTSGAYAITFNGGAAINTGYELPPSGTPTNGILTVSTAGTNVSLQADATIGTLTTSIASTTTFNLNGFSLGLTLATPLANTGVINASASTSTLVFKGTVAQTFALTGSYTSSIISNVIIDNSFSSSGLTLGTSNINVGNLTVNAARFLTFNGLNINIKNNLQNNGTINSSVAGSTITMNGTTAQTIDGSGVWTTGTTGRLLNLVINNAAGVTSNSTFALQTSLTLAAGALTSSMLTIGIPATVFTTTRTAGSLTNAPTFNYTSGAYAITFNGGAAINTGYELPPSGTPTNGILTVSTAGTNVSLQADATIGTLTTSIASTTTFNLNGFSLGLTLATPLANTGVINASASTSTLVFKGTVAQTFALAGTYTSSLISNVIVDNSFSSTGLTLSTSNINVGNLTVNASRFLTLGGLNINIKNNLQNDGTITSTAAGSTITMNGSIAQTIAGSGAWTTGTTGRLLNMVINNTAGVTLNPTLVLQNSLSLTAGALTSSTLTIGIPATPFTLTRTAGSLTNAPAFNYTTGAYAITYNGNATINTGNELPAPTTPTNGALTVSLASTKVNLSQNLIVSSLVTTPAGATFDLNANMLSVTGTTTPISNTGTIVANAAGSVLKLSATGATTVTLGGTFTSSVIDNIIIAPTSGATILTISLPSTNSINNLTINTLGTLGSSATINSSLVIASGATFSLGSSSYVLTLKGSYSNSAGTLTANGTGATIILNGSSPQSFSPGTYTGSSITVFEVNNSTGVTIGSALNVGTLKATSGIIDNGSNLITITGGTASNLVGGSSTAYLKGPLARTLQASLGSGSVFNWPIGKSGYQLFTLTNPTTTAGGTVVIQAEVFDANAGGTAGPGVSALNTNRYWSALINSGSAFLTSAGSAMSITESGLTNGTHQLCNSSTAAGSYSLQPSTVAGSIITSNSSAPIGLGYFVIGTVGTLGGTYTVGAGGQFQKLYQVANILNTATVTNNTIFELRSDYDGTTGESFPIIFNQFAQSGGTWNVTIRPETGVSTRTTSGDAGSNLPLINLNGIDRLTLDGRAGGSGSTIGWIVRNTRTTSTVGPAIQLQSGANFNTLQYLQVESQNSQASSGTIFITANAAPATTNTDDVIQNCNITNYTSGAATHVNAIFAYGNASTQFNNNISILNNNISNFTPLISTKATGISVTGTGLNSGGYGSGWTITGNSFFKSVTEQSNYQYVVINFAPSPTGAASTGNTISDNYIGGNASALAGGSISGTWITGVAGVANSNPTFQGINIQALGATVSNNKIGGINNTVNGVSLTEFVGIFVSANGNHTISDNVIGSPATGLFVGSSTSSVAIGTGAKTFTTQAGLSYVNGDRVIVTNTATSTNYMIGSVTSYSGATLTLSVDVTGGGGTLAAWDILPASGVQNRAQQFMIGIWDQSAGTGAITDNVIANLTNTNATNSAAATCGIVTQNGTYTITGNSVYNLTSACATTASTLYASVDGSVVGIANQSILSNAVQTVSNNTVYNLKSTLSSATATKIHGIHLSGTASSSYTHNANGNLIYNFDVANTNTLAQLYGLYLNSGTYNVTNNMIRLGIRSDASSITGSASICGIYDGEPGSSTIGTMKIYHNSIYIGGTSVVGGAINTYAYRRNNTNSSPKNIVDIKNNIFTNSRSNTSGTAVHFAVGLDNTSGITTDYNNVYVNGTGSQCGQITTTPYLNLSAWNGANNSFDANSNSGDPKFISPTSGTPDLHISNLVATPVESAGTNAATVSTDFDGQTRSSYTPVDMGADAADFIPIDVTPPTINYTPFSSICPPQTSTLNVGGVTITDGGPGSSVNTTAGTKPRIYYKKSSDTNNTFNDNTSSTTGWKYVEATGTTSPFDFTINFALLNGGLPTAGDALQYFIVAQDQGANVPSPNVGINSGSFASPPASVNLTSTAFAITGSINQFTILPCSGIVTVGTGGNYASLTNSGGVFEAINATTLTGNLTVQIISDLSAETGTNALNQWTEAPSNSNYSVTLKSDTTTVRTISGSYNGTAVANNGLIRLNSADRVTFNGGTGNERRLIFRNTNTGSFAATFNFINDATNNQVNNVTIEGAPLSISNGVVYFGTASGGGNDSNIITNCDISNQLNSSSVFPYNAIYSAGSASPNLNNNITVQNCNISNFFFNSGISSGIRLDAGNAAWTIQNNRIFQTASRNSTSSGTEQYLIYLNSAASGGYLVDSNILGYQSSSGTGTYTITSTPTNLRFVGIYILTSSGSQNTISDNSITALNISSSNGTNSGYGVLSGIYVSSGSNIISGNTIGNATGNDQIVITTSTAGAVSYGISQAGAQANTITANIIGGITTLGSTTSISHSLIAINNNSAGAAVNITDNLIGSSVTARSLSANTATTINAPGTAQTVTGITSQGSSGGNILISGNQIRNLYVNSTTSASSASLIRGIDVSGLASHDTKNNIIYNLESEAINSGTTLTGAVIGILNNQNTGGSSTKNIENNVIYGLQSNAASTATSIYGILVNVVTGSPTFTIARNFIHSFNSGNSSVSAEQVGIYAAYNATITNNMVRLGTKTDGSSVNQPQVLTGILDATTGSCNYYFNTVLINGTASLGSTNSYAFRRTSASGTKDFRNNILSNERTGGTGSNYSFATNTLTGFSASTFDYNLFYSATNTEFSIVASPTALTGSSATLRLQNLRAQSPANNNLHSGIASPSQINFLNSTGNASSVNLRLGNLSSAAGSGITISGITSDIDGTITRSNSPAIGAHESSSFAAVDNTTDVFSPIISVASTSEISAACGSEQTVTITATVSDFGTGLASGILAPTLWWRLSSGSYASLPPSNIAGNTFSYNLNLTGISNGQTYHFYVAAQDASGTPNIAYSHFNATSPVHSDVSSTASVINGAPGTFIVSSVSPLSGTVTVGSGGNYSTLTAASTGLFNAINTNGLNGNLVVKIISNTTETGAVQLNQWTEYCGSNYTVLIRSDTTTLRTLSGTLNAGTGLITLNGADRVTIDGANGGSGQYIKVTNSTTATNGAAAISLQNDATNNVIANCYLESGTQSLTNGVFSFLTSTGTLGNSDNTVRNNLITGTSNWARVILYSSGSAGATNKNNLIQNNEVRNFMLWSGAANKAYGIYITPTGNGGGWNIIGNSVYNTGINGQNTQTALSFEPGSSSTGNTIKQNWIGGSAPQCGSTSGIGYWGNSWDDGTENQVRGIYVNAGTVALDSNNVSNINISNADYSGFVGIYIAGSTQASVTNNVFGTGSNGQPDNSKMIIVQGGGASGGFFPGYIYGIWNQSTTTAMTTYDKNDFYYLWQSGAYEGGNVHCISHQSAGPATITRNRINGPQGNGAYYNQFGIRFEPTASTSGNVIEDNLVAGPYTNGAALDNNGFNFGIYVKSLSIYTHSGSISKNTIWDMRSSSYGGQGGTEGIYVWSSTGGNGNWDITNNQVTLRNNGSSSNCLGLYGIDIALNSASTTNVKYNTVYISGSNGGAAVSGADFSSYAFLRLPNSSGNVVGDNITLQNNIFINYRLVSSSAVKGHFAIGNVGTSNFTSNWSVSDYNFLAVANGSKSYLGQWGTAVQSTFTNWKTTSSKDANSFSANYSAGSSNFSANNLNPDNLFLNPLSDLHISIADGQSYKFVDGRATTVALDIDYDGNNRDDSTPDIGADEFAACSAPVVSSQPTATQSVCQNGTPSNLVATVTGSGLSYQWYSNVSNSNTGGTGLGSNNGAQTDTYTPVTSAIGTLYYYVVVSSSCGSVSSNTAAVTVTSPPTWYLDVDSDGFAASSTTSCTNPGAGYTSTILPVTDCDDTNNTIWQSELLYVDVDNDGYTSGTATVCYGSSLPSGYSQTSNGTDCDDEDNTIWQSALLYVDADDDGYTNGTATICYGASVPSGYSISSNGNDCDDTNSSIWTNAALYIDTDADGYDNGTTTAICYGETAPSGYSLTSNGTDCNDYDNTVWTSSLLYVDLDGDGYDNGSGTFCYGATLPSGYTPSSGGSDCNDANNNVWTSSSLYIDQDGDGYDNGHEILCYGATVPAGHSLTSNGSDCNDNDNTKWQSGSFYVDVDGDTYFAYVTICYGATVPSGYFATTNSAIDCADNNNDINPGADEWYNGLDDNCDGEIDEGVSGITFYQDTDGDGYGNPSVFVVVFAQPQGYVTDNTDCNDSNAGAHPGAMEVCNHIDDDCDGIIDEGCNPSNEERQNAILLPQVTYPSCSNLTGSLAFATASSQPGATCLTGEDVWYYFAATSTAVRVQCVSSANNLLIELQNSSGTLIDVEDVQNVAGNEFLNYYGLTVGSTYYVRVRNYNSGQGRGSFQICLQKLPPSACILSSSPYNLCTLFKAQFLSGVGSYKFDFSPVGSPQTVYSKTQTSDLLPLYSALTQPGFNPYNITYNITITANWILTKGNGTSETIQVPMLSPCQITVAPEPVTELRAADRCSTGPRRIYDWVRCGNLCGATDYRWSFEEMLGGVIPSGLPIIVYRGAASDQIKLSNIAQLQLGKTYRVRIAGVYGGIGSAGIIGTFGPWQTLCILGSAMTLTENNESLSHELNERIVGNLSLPAIYPNPNDGSAFNLNVDDINGEQLQVIITDALGRHVTSRIYSVRNQLRTTIVFDQPLTSGLYMVELVYDNKRETQRILIQR